MSKGDRRFVVRMNRFHGRAVISQRASAEMAAHDMERHNTDHCAQCSCGGAHVEDRAVQSGYLGRESLRGGGVLEVMGFEDGE